MDDIVEKPLVRTVSALLYFDPSEYGLVNSNYEVLLHKHKIYGTFFGPGGKVAPNELDTDALAREFLEETGLDISGYLHPNPIDLYRKDYLAPNFITLIDDDTRDVLNLVYCIRVGQYTRKEKLVAEEGIPVLQWYSIDYAINNLNVPKDTLQQLMWIRDNDISE